MLSEVVVGVCECVCKCALVQEISIFVHYEGLPCMILGHFSGGMQQLLCRTKPAGHWQPGTHGLKQWLSITPSGTSTLKHVTGQGGPHSSNTKPLSTGQPTAVEDGWGKELGEREESETFLSEVILYWWLGGIDGKLRCVTNFSQEGD